MPLACAINLSLISPLSSLSFLVGSASWCHLPFKADEEAASGLIVSAASFLLYLRCLVLVFFLERGRGEGTLFCDFFPPSSL